MKFIFHLRPSLTLFAFLACWPMLAWGQGAPPVKFPSSNGIPNTGSIYTPSVTTSPYTGGTAPAVGNPGFGAPAPTSGATIGTPYSANPYAAAPYGANPGASFGTPSAISPNSPLNFDPYSLSPDASRAWWNGANPPSGQFGSNPFGRPPINTSPGFGNSSVPAWRQTGVVGNPNAPYGATNPYAGPYGTPYANTFGSPNSNTLYPNGIFGSNDPNAQPYDWNQVYRLFEDLRLRHTYVIDGSGPTDLAINDTEVSITMNIPNFLWTNQPIHITPAFALHLWQGPHDIPADLPANAYSAYLDAQWSSNPQLQLGAEIGFRVGAYTDFKTINSHSVRYQGLGLGTLRLTPTATLKLGAMYLDRNKIKLLPAGGVVWQPNPQTRFDIIFPQPKLSQFLTNLNGGELWWYVSGEYGGGAWTIQRADASTDRIDINDVRVGLGFDWMGQAGFHGFFEGGFLFYREVVYVTHPADTFNPGDAYYIRGGVAY